MTERPVMTVLEGQVPSERWAELAEIYSRIADRLPSQIHQTFLVQSVTDPSMWRVISIWRSRAALEEYRRSVETPGGVLMFRSVGAEPVLTLWPVAASVPKAPGET